MPRRTSVVLWIRVPAERTSQPRRLPSRAAACLQVSVTPPARISRKLEGTRST
jgi:hypothetical protein